MLIVIFSKKKETINTIYIVINTVYCTTVVSKSKIDNRKNITVKNHKIS